jgi:hypothetical protein
MTEWHILLHFSGRYGRFRTPQLFYTFATTNLYQGDPIKPNHVVEESGKDWRRRTFEQGQDIFFTDTMFISDSAIPKEEEYTVLKFNTTEDSLWEQNMRNLRARGSKSYGIL